MINSTLGFIFTPSLEEVLLITKKKPAFHKGKLNGLGGKTEVGESSLECIVREVTEEASLIIPAEKWLHLGEMSWTEWNVAIFTTVYSGNKEDACSPDTDAIAWYPCTQLPAHVLTNLTWLIPLAIDCLTQTKPPRVEIEYPD